MSYEHDSPGQQNSKDIIPKTASVTKRWNGQWQLIAEVSCPAILLRCECQRLGREEVGQRKEDRNQGVYGGCRHCGAGRSGAPGGNAG